MKKGKVLYEGKAKKVIATDDPNLVIQEFKDDATAFNGEKKDQIKGKGVINNKISSILFKMLGENGVRTHFKKEISDNEMLIKKVNIVPLEVIIRNVAAGSFSKRYGVKEGTELKRPTVEFSYKKDELGDPLINRYHAMALDIATEEDMDKIQEMAFKINDLLKEYFDKKNVILVDFKLEFGKTKDGEIILADEISPDTCRYWDKETKEKLDKDRFRRNLGSIEEAYQEMLKRLT
ncbi:MAG: phosphoribosylaminoimidazolesuccinocarboxamide synthase [Fusobacteriota bacterium]